MEMEVHMSIDEKGLKAAREWMGELPATSDEDILRGAIEAYEAAKQPVSLEQCALAVCRADAEWDMNIYNARKPHPRGVKLTRIALDAAGVSYVD